MALTRSGLLALSAKRSSILVCKQHQPVYILSEATSRVVSTSNEVISTKTDATDGYKASVESGDVYGSPTGMVYNFDTHKLVLKLQRNGFSGTQAESLVSALTEISSSSMTYASAQMVSKTEQAKMELRINAVADAIRKDMIILEKSEFTLLKGENEKIKAEVQQLRKLLNDELLKLKSSVTLDMTLEKGRSNEEASSLKQLIKDTNNRIETEVAKLRTDMEAQKLDLIKYLVGSVLSLVTVSVGVWRFLKS